MQINKQRMGKFTISKELFEKLPENFFSQFAIYHAESVDFGRSIEYYAFSELFGIVSGGEITPEYVIKIDMNGSYSAERVINYYQRHLEQQLEKYKAECESLKLQLEEEQRSHQKICNDYYFTLVDALNTVDYLSSPRLDQQLIGWVISMFKARHEHNLVNFREIRKKYEEGNNV